MTSGPDVAAEITVPIEVGHIVMFRRALGDADAALCRPKDAEQFRWVPPTFPQVYVHFDPSYDLRPSADNPWFGSGAGPGAPRSSSDGEGMRLHAEQSFSYERPLLPGEVLTARRRPGETWTKRGSRGGDLTFIETFVEFFDGEGSLVVTIRGVSVRTSKKVDEG